MNESAPSGAVQMQVQWIYEPNAVPSPVNQFILQAGPDVQNNGVPDSFIMTFGHVTPPFMPAFASEQEAREFAESNSVQVVAVARLTFSPARVRELHSALGDMVKQLDDSGA